MTTFNTKKRSFNFVNGYYSETASIRTSVNGEEVINVTDLDRHKSSRCWVLYTAKHIYLQSYNTIVSDYDRETKVLTEERYSMTTSKQQSWFRGQISRDYFIERVLINK